MLNLKILKINFHSEFDPFYEKTHKLFGVVSCFMHHSAQFNWSAEQISLEMRQSTFLIAKDEALDKVVGFIAFREGLDQIEIMALGVLPEVRRNGCMKQLLVNLLDYSHQQLEEGCKVSKAIVLEVHEQNESAIKLYRNCSLFEIGRRRKYYSDGADALIFSSVQV